MTLRRRRFFAWSGLGVFITLGAVWLAGLDFQQKIAIDVLDLIPTDERDPQLAVVRELAREAEARTMLLVLTGANGAPAPLEVTRDFVAELRRSPHFSQVIALADSKWREPLGRELFERRFTLLFPLWLREQREVFRSQPGPRFDEWLAGKAAADLEKFLQSPEAVAFQDMVVADAMLLVPRALERLGRTLALVAGDASSAAASGLVWAQISAPPLMEEGQEPVFAAIAAATSTLRARTPDLGVAYTGVNRFAQASRTRIQREVTWLNLASLAAVLAVSAMLIPRLARGLHLVPVVLLSMLGASVATTLAFERVHILVFVLGSLLAGVAIDYGFHIYTQPPANPGELYWAKVRRIRKPLVASCLTTVVGFAVLLGAELPLLRQLGVYVIAGLLSAAGAAVVYFSAVREPWLETRAAGGAWLRREGIRRRGAQLMVGLLILAAAGVPQVTWRDDIRELEVPEDRLQAEDARIRSAFNQGPERTLWLTQGRTLDEARAALRRLETHRAVAGIPLASLGAVIPTRSDHEEALRFIQENPSFARLLRGALERRGFEPAAFPAFFEALENYGADDSASDLNAAVRRLQGSLSGPLGLLLHTSPHLNWFVTITAGRIAIAPPLETNTVAVSQLRALNELFARYRGSALKLSLAGLAVLGAGVGLAYGPRSGLRIFSVPCAACLGMFGVFGWLGQPLNMFHLLGAFLGVCLTHDYAIFSAGSAQRGESPPASVRLAALTTFASFGVLALCAIPAVRALGASVALMVMVALPILEFEPRRAAKR